jgi:hypothetical protein
MHKKRHDESPRRRLVQMDRRHVQRRQLHLCDLHKKTIVAKRNLWRNHKKKNG